MPTLDYGMARSHAMLHEVESETTNQEDRTMASNLEEVVMVPVEVTKAALEASAAALKEILNALAGK